MYTKNLSYTALLVSIISIVIVVINLFSAPPEITNIRGVIQDTTFTNQEKSVLTRLEILENRSGAIEKKLERQNEYYFDTLSGDRMIFATFLTLLAALLGLVGFGFVRDLRSTVNELEEKVGGISGRLDETIEVAESLEKKHHISEASIARMYAMESEKEGKWISATSARINALKEVTQVEKTNQLHKDIEDSIENIEENVSKAIDEGFWISVEDSISLIEKTDGVIDNINDSELEDDMNKVREKIKEIETKRVDESKNGEPDPAD